MPATLHTVPAPLQLHTITIIVNTAITSTPPTTTPAPTAMVCPQLTTVATTIATTIATTAISKNLHAFAMLAAFVYTHLL